MNPINYYKSELDLTLAICTYLRKNNYLFLYDIAAGLHLSAYQSLIASKTRTGRGMPDIIVFHKTQNYSGYAFEVKKNKEAYLNKNGTFKSTPHLKEQIEMLKRFEEQGFYTSFVTSVDEVKKILETIK